MVNIVRNLKKNGIELTFDSKPSFDVLQWLKSNKYRWSSFQMVWWKKFDQNSWDQVHAQFNQVPAAQPVKPVSTEPVFHGVTFNEFILLDITASLKSFARDEHLKRNIVFKEKDSLRQSLTDKGMMKRNGAITDMGRKTRDEVIKDSPYNSGMYYSGYDKIKDKWGTMKQEPVSDANPSFAEYLKESREVYGWKNNEAIHEMYKILLLQNAYEAEINAGSDIKNIIEDARQGIAMNLLKVKITNESSFVYGKRKVAELMERAKAEGKDIKSEENKTGQSIKTIESDIATQEAEQERVESDIPGSIRPEFMTNKPMIKGREIQISMPNGEKRNALFAIVELNDIIASHNEDNFHSEPGYPKNATGNNINDRNYKDDLAAQKAVMDYARELEPERLITTSRTPSGTPIITKDGFVVSENNRTMSLKLAAKQYPDNYQEYVKFLSEEVESFGFKDSIRTQLRFNQSIISERGESAKENKYVTFTHPVLVRIDLDFPQYTTQELSKYNKDTKKAERPIDKAIKLSNILRDNSRCAEIIADITGEYETFSEFYANIVAQKRLAKTLVECNLLTEQELPAYFSDTTFTETGKEFIENLLAALILDREALMATEQAGVKTTRQKLITSLPVLMKNANLPEGSLKKNINDAVILQQIIKTSGSEFADFIRQANLFGTTYEKKTVYLNRLIDSGKFKFKQAIEGYNDAIIKNQGPSLFGDKPSTEDIFNHWIKGNVSDIDQRLIEASKLVSSGDFKLTDAQKEIIKPEWDKMQEFLQKEEKASELGKLAFERGAKRVPAHDKELMKLLENQVGESIPILDAWTKAWDKANLSAPVEVIEENTGNTQKPEAIKNHGQLMAFLKSQGVDILTTDADTIAELIDKNYQRPQLPPASMAFHKDKRKCIDKLVQFSKRAAGKLAQPWQMTLETFATMKFLTEASAEFSIYTEALFVPVADYRISHKKELLLAIENKEPISDVVLADYPELSVSIKENTFIDQARAAEEKHDKIHTEFLRFTNDEDPKDRFKIYLVNGNEVRKDHIEFTMGGHGYVYGYVPKDEIWIDENLKDKPDDMEATIKHEVYEVHKMRDEGLDYESAHELANKIESGERNKTEGETFTEKLGFRYLNVSGYYGSQSEEGLIEQGWKYIRDIYPIVTEKDYFLGTDGTFETSSEEEFKSIDAPLFRSESLSKNKIKDGILYRGSDHWGKASSCNWYAPFEIKPWQKGNFYYFKIPLSKLTRNKNIIIEGEIKLTPNTSATKIAFLKQIKFIETGETRIDKDYEPDDVEYNHRKVYIPVYMTLWHYAENTDPDSEKFDNINDAVNDLQKTGRGDPDKGFSPVKELLINLKEAWVDTNNQIIEEGEIISYYDFIESNPDNAFVKQFGTEGTIDSNSFEERESSAKKLLDEVYSNIHKDILKEYEEKGVRLNIITPKDGKYRHVSVEDDQGAEIGSFKLRIADHSYNPSNNDTDAQSGNFISIEIANKNETAGRFHGKYGLQFTGDDSYTDVIDAINERIKEIIYKWDIKTPVMENAVKAQTETKDDISEVRLKKLMLLRKFISVSQHEALSDLMMGEEGQAGWEIVDRLGSIIETMPHTYQTEDINTNDKIVYLHYFNGGSDWYIVEKDKLMPQNQAFGYAILNGDSINAEWGYISILELIQNNVELDFYWTPKKFGEVIKKEEKPKQLEPDVIISSELAEPEIIGNVIPKKWEPIVKEAYQFNAKPGIAAIADDIIDLYLYRQMRTYGMYNDKVLQTIGASIKKQKDNMFYVMDQNGSIFLESGGSGRPSYYDEVKEIWGEKFADLAKKDGGVLMRNKEPEPSDKKQELLDEIESLEKNIRNGEKLMQKASFTGDVTKDIVKDRAKLEKKKQEYVNAYGVIPEKQAELSLNSSDYKNEFELNKAIEKLLDSKWNEKQWSPEELQFLKGYSGYGGLDQFGEITKGSLFEYFTPDQVIEKMWGLAYKYGYTNGPVLEPSCGIGPFFDRRFVSNTIEKHGYEINKYSAKIAKLLYPEAIINDGEEVKYFEQLFIVQNYTVRSKVTPKYRLVIGNPPYGTVGGIYMGMGEKAYTHANNYIDYFILRGLDLLEKGGLLIYIIGAETAGGGVPFLDQGMNKVKEMIMERGKLIDAYRLPSGVFARTEVTSDIVVFRKR